MNFDATYILRAKKMILETKSDLNIDLKDLNVLTELGSGNYLLSPIIPLLCGAKHVFAFVKDTKYGLAKEIIENFNKLQDSFQIRNNITIIENILDDEIISKCDIITNSGMLRPLNDSKLKHFKKGAVLPLMFEAWEIRESDIDLGSCFFYKIKVSGTWENHPKIKVFEYVKMLALKMVFEAGFEVIDNSIFIWSDDHFGDFIFDSFKKNGAKECFLSVDPNLLVSVISKIDFIFFAQYSQKENIFDLIDFKRLVEMNPTLMIIHLFGEISVEQFQQIGIKVYPNFNGYSHNMTFTLSHVGISPYIKLQAAGYRVAQEMILNEYSSISQPFD